MVDYVNIKRDLMLDEGLRLKPYRDTVGKLTVGYGRNIEDVGITQAEAELMLDSDILRAEQALDKYAPWWRTLNDVRQNVLLNMCFNMGWGTLCKFTSTLAFIQDGSFAKAAGAMKQSRWASQVGQRAVRLCKQMETGVEQS